VQWSYKVSGPELKKEENWFEKKTVLWIGIGFSLDLNPDPAF
jgi:hypothetical protein